MKNRKFVGLLAGVFLAACGGDSGGTNAGGGTQTLLVRGDVEWNEDANAAAIEVTVLRGDAFVDGASVVVHTNLGDVTLVQEGSDFTGKHYVGLQAGWAAYYELDVVAGEDRLNGSITAPDQMTLVSPELTRAVDARMLLDGVLPVRWSGDYADSIRVRSKDFEYRGTDEGHVDMPATMLTEESQELELRRDNSIALAGGVVGSTLTATCRNNFSLIVVNPY